MSDDLFDYAGLLRAAAIGRALNPRVRAQEEQQRIQEAQAHQLKIEAAKDELAMRRLEAKKMMRDAAEVEAARAGERTLLDVPGATPGAPPPVPVPPLELGPTPGIGMPAPVVPQPAQPGQPAFEAPAPFELQPVPELGLVGRTASPVREALMARAATKRARAEKLAETFASAQAAGLGGGHLVQLPTGEVVPTALAKPPKEKGLTHVDLGDRIGWADEAGNIVRTQPKGAAPAKPTPSLTEGADYSKSGDEFFNTLPPETQSVVGGLLDYSLDPSKSSSMRGNRREQLIAAAKRVDPGFDMKAYPTRQKIKADFATGNTSKSLDSLNQLSGHIQMLDDSFAAEKNNDIPRINAFVNGIRSAFGDPTITNARTARIAVAEEVARLMRGGIGTEAQTKHWESAFSTSGSPAQQMGAVTVTRGLVGHRLGAIKQRYRAGMGSDSGFEEYLTPEAQALFGKTRSPAGEAKGGNLLPAHAGKFKVGRFEVEVQ